MKRLLLVGLVTCFVSATQHVNAQYCCCRDYLVVCQTVYQPQSVTTYRLVYETQYVEQKIITQRPVWETKMEQRTFQVAKPVTETSEHEQRYKVMHPVWHTVEHERQFTVQRPVIREIMQDRTYTTYEPVTTMGTQIVDQGHYVNQVQATPSPVRRRLRLLRRQYYNDPQTGILRWQRPGLYWVPTQGRGTTKVNRVWAPNYVTQQIPQTTYQAKQVVQQVPVQVTQYENHVVTEKIPMQTLQWQEQEIVRSFPITRTRMEYEERTQQVPVQVRKMVTDEKKVMVPRRVSRWVPVTYSCMKPRTVVMRVPVETLTEITSLRPVHAGDSFENGPVMAPQHSENQSVLKNSHSSPHFDTAADIDENAVPNNRGDRLKEDTRIGSFFKLAPESSS